LASKSFEYVEKVEKEAKTSVQSLKDMHNEAVANMYEYARTLNKKLGGFASEVVGKIDGEIEGAVEKAEEVVAETKEALADKPAVKKAPAKKAAAKEEATA
jgi:gas vesicle protein